jgi:hypothetical protein
MGPPAEKPNLPPAEASEYLERCWGIKRKPTTLAKLRCVSSDGPIFFKANRQILYPRSGLDEYAAALLSSPRRSTSDGDGAGTILRVAKPEASTDPRKTQRGRGQSRKRAIAGHEIAR